jgi:hypothetical protein
VRGSVLSIGGYGVIDASLEWPAALRLAKLLEENPYASGGVKFELESYRQSIADELDISLRELGVYCDALRSIFPNPGNVGSEDLKDCGKSFSPSLDSGLNNWAVFNEPACLGYSPPLVFRLGAAASKPPLDTVFQVLLQYIRELRAELGRVEAKIRELIRRNSLPEEHVQLISQERTWFLYHGDNPPHTALQATSSLVPERVPTLLFA